MIFTKRGAFHQVSRVTGPRQNHLAIELTTGTQGTQPGIESVAGFRRVPGELDTSAIVSAVLEGLVLANGTFNTEYAVSRIQYYMGDNPPEEIYGALALRIVERLVGGGEFSTQEAEDG